MGLTKKYLTSKTVIELKKKKRKLYNDLYKIDSFAMANINTRLHYCQKQGCKCMDEENPQPHGKH